MLGRFVPTSRGGSKLYCDGYFYRYEKKAQGDQEKHFWKCEKGCPARAETDKKEGGATVKLGPNGHNRPPSPASAADALQRIEGLKKRVREEPTATTQQLLAGAVEGANNTALALMPNKKALKSVAHRQRQKKEREEALANDAEGGAPPCDDNLADLKIPKPLTVIDGEGNFLLSDSGGANRILIFGAAATASFLDTCQVWSSDGTFKVTNFFDRWGGGGRALNDKKRKISCFV